MRLNQTRIARWRALGGRVKEGCSPDASSTQGGHGISKPFSNYSHVVTAEGAQKLVFDLRDANACR
jgi:hypothetical protein